MIHVITLPNQRQCRVGQYAAAWRTLLKAKPEASFPGFGFHAETAASILSAMRGGLSERINRHIPGYGIGRNWSNDRFYALWRDSRRVRDIVSRRLRVYQFETDTARKHFGQLLSKQGE